MRWWVYSSCLLWGQVATLPCVPTRLAVDELGHIYAWCDVDKALLKLWAPRYDSLSRIGGGPASREGFFAIHSLATIGNQQLYVLDGGRQTLFLLGTNLQVLQKIRFEEMAPELWQGFPTHLSAMPGGDLFIALRETQEIVRVDAFGRILVRFGGKLAGPAALVRIHDLQASETALTVLDQGYQLKVFDPWGSLLTTSTLPPTMQFCVLGRHNLLYKTPNEWVYIPDSRQPSQKYPLSGLPNDQPTAGYLTSTHFYYAMGRALFVYPLP